MAPESKVGVTIVEMVSGEVSVEGPPRSGMRAEEARHYLRRHNDGFLQHNLFDENSFIAIDRGGIWLFYDGVEDTITRWDWITDMEALRGDGSRLDPMVDWHYLPGSEMALTKGGLEWWREIQQGFLTPPATMLQLGAP